MEPEKIKCYLYRRADTKQWTATTNDLPAISVTCQEPEDALRRVQILVLREIADQIDYSSRKLSSNLELSIHVEIVSENEARRLLFRDDPLI